MVIKSWCRYFTGKFIRAWPAITLHAPDMNEKLWEQRNQQPADERIAHQNHRDKPNCLTDAAVFLCPVIKGNDRLRTVDNASNR